MTCAEHNRTHCQEPRCYVLAVCAASIPRDNDHPSGIPWCTLRQWGYGSDGHTERECWGEISSQIATRLVAWMRWRGERRAGAIRLSGYAVYGQPSDPGDEFPWFTFYGVHDP